VSSGKDGLAAGGRRGAKARQRWENEERREAQERLERWQREGRLVVRQARPGELDPPKNLPPPSPTQRRNWIQREEDDDLDDDELVGRPETFDRKLA
jgi:hypothetical protein